jgi:cytochrome c oxidase assembly protein subunit 11
MSATTHDHEKPAIHSSLREAEADWDAAEAAPVDPAVIRRRNKRLVLVLAAVGLGMLGFAYANVPLFTMLCGALGIGYDPNSAELAGAGTVTDRQVDVLFMGSVAGTLPVRFQPMQKRLPSTLGQVTVNDYRFINTTDRTIYFRAVHHITPTSAAADGMFNLAQCFCFTAQRLHPGQSVTVPVAFSFSPELPEGVSAVTINYTLMPLTREAYESEIKSESNVGPHSQINP